MFTDVLWALSLTLFLPLGFLDFDAINSCMGLVIRHPLKFEPVNDTSYLCVSLDTESTHIGQIGIRDAMHLPLENQN